MVPSLRPLSIRDTPSLHCFGLYTLGNLSRHVKGAHPLASLVLQCCDSSFRLVTKAKACKGVSQE
jgi:hypothetical protein